MCSRANRAGISLLAIWMSTCLSILAQPDPPKADSSVETEHFVIHWDSVQVPKETIDLARQRAEEAYLKLSRFLGQEKVPAGKATLLIEGEARREDGSYRVPHVDGQGRIHLYRYTGSDESYFTTLSLSPAQLSEDRIGQEFVAAAGRGLQAVEVLSFGECSLFDFPIDGEAAVQGLNDFAVPDQV